MGAGEVTGGPHGACTDEVCITCSDQAVPVRILERLDDDLARVDTGVSVEVVSVALVDAEVGSTVLVHAGEAIAVVPSDPAPGDRSAREQPAAGVVH